MALQDLTITYLRTGSPHNDGSGTKVWTYRTTTKSWNTITKLVVGPTIDTMDLPIEEPYPENYSRPTTLLVDEYTVPASPTAPGYDAAAVGKVRKIYHDGSGDVVKVDSAGCDLVIVSSSSTGTTSVGSATGTITVEVSSSAPTRQVRLNGGGWQTMVAATFTFTGLSAANNHVVEARDDNPTGCLVSVTVTVGEFSRMGCRDPSATNYDPLATEDGVCAYVPAQEQAIFSIPETNSLRFVIPPAAYGPNGPFRNSDNTLLADQQHPGVSGLDYCQKVAKVDVITIQFKSNFTAHTVQLRRSDNNATVKTFGTVRIVRGQGNTAAFAGYLTRHTTGQQARVYFSNGVLPLPFLIGNRIVISNTLTGLDKTYPVVKVSEDAAEGIPYLVINAEYAATTTDQRLDCTITTTYDVQQFDTLQTTLSFGTVATGCYYLLLTATDPELGSARAVSEPIDLRVDHAGTVLVTYRNNDNAFNINYTHGILHRLRVVARKLDEAPATTKDILVDSSQRTRLLASTARLKLRLETFQLPAYLHTKLALACCHDQLTVDGIRYVAEEGYERPPLQRWALANGSVLLTQFEWLGAGNSDDLGDLNTGEGFIEVEDGFLRI